MLPLEEMNIPLWNEKYYSELTQQFVMQTLQTTIFHSCFIAASTLN